MNPVDVIKGDGPVILGQPHGGTFVPEDITSRLDENGLALADTDWHITRLYDGLCPGATVVRANFHRYVIDANRAPDDASLGEELKITVQTNLKKKGTCQMSIAWPGKAAGTTSGESKSPDDSGKCSWKVVVPTTIEKKGTAKLNVTVSKDSSSRTVTKEFEVKK